MLKDLIKLASDFKEAHVPTPKESTTIIEAVETSLKKEEAESYQSKRFSPGSYRCARWEAHRRLNDFKPKMADNEPATLKLFKAGHALHTVLQNEMLGPTGKLWGNWKCRSCGTVKKYQTIPSTVCTGHRVSQGILEEPEKEPCAEVLRREDHAWEYQELYMREDPLDHEDYQIAGFTDGIWIEDDGTWKIMEGKSADEMAFDNMTQVKYKEIDGAYIRKPTQGRHPIKTHVDQAMVYSELISQAARRGDLPLDPDKYSGVIILYICRNTGRLKEYHLNYTPGPYNDLLNLAKITKAAVEAGNEFLAPARCTSATNILAKKCPLAGKCFPKKKK